LSGQAVDQERLVPALQHGNETGVDVLYDGEKIVARCASWSPPRTVFVAALSAPRETSRTRQASLH
jgi:hypothetical protein